MGNDAFERMQVFLVRVKRFPHIDADNTTKAPRRDQLRGLAERLLRQVAVGERVILASSRIRRTAAGQPYLHGPSGFKSPAISISHRGNYLALAIHQSALGVDLENMRARKNYLEMADYMFHGSEAASLRNHSDTHGLRLFYAYWTMREALAKSSGVPLLTLTNTAKISVAREVAPSQRELNLFQTSLGENLCLACCGSALAYPRLYLCSLAGHLQRELFPRWRLYAINRDDAQPESAPQ